MSGKLAITGLAAVAVMAFSANTADAQYIVRHGNHYHNVSPPIYVGGHGHHHHGYGSVYQPVYTPVYRSTLPVYNSGFGFNTPVYGGYNSGFGFPTYNHGQSFNTVNFGVYRPGFGMNLGFVIR